MEFAIFFKEICIGFALAVPTGPIGIMCIRKTLTEERLRGLIIGLGAATSDIIYGTVAAFGYIYFEYTFQSTNLDASGRRNTLSRIRYKNISRTSI